MAIKSSIQACFLLLCFLTGLESRLFFRYPYSYNTFMRKVTLDYEKVKVETLGAIFKRHVQQLRNTPNRQVELVFLIDSSGTVGKHYFYQELSFVQNLLADFTVDMNSTRVSVITFSSPNKVYRHIDYLSHPDLSNHKCKLLHNDLEAVKYTPGGTFTLGAFLEAEKVLESARPSAAKAIFLMTDGYSNGGDPSFVASKLKQEGVKIFTFGIHNGNVWELKRIASEPKNETCYILDSFQEFEALAKRALHADLQSGSYISQPASQCDSLCSGSGPCCHSKATCSCGTYTGRYECLCSPGYYGSGRGKTGCKPCPEGTYKNFTGLGNVDVCTSCPDEHQTTPVAATSVNMCTCKRGYRSFGHTACTVFRCPELSPPEHGYFVNNKCNNVFNAACGLRCQQGYQLTGSSLRICQDDGTWSGTEATCIMKTCPSLPVPKNGHMVCSSEDFSYSTVCRFTCNVGYQLVGSRKRTCLAIADWTGITTRCREITCPPLVSIKDGTITPASCTARDVVFGSTCTVSCSAGYVLKGPLTKQCTPDGTWTAVEEGANRCLDETSPVLQCPNDIVVNADPEKERTEVSWAAPVPVDNSGFRPVLTADPTVAPGDLFPIGRTEVTYSAEDLSQNVATCTFTVTVVDTTPPRVDQCVSPPPVVTHKQSAVVRFDPPVFSDNSGRPVEIAGSHRSGGVFPLGTTRVTFIAFDVVNNNSTCTIEVNVIPHLCVLPTPPVHGNMSCKEGDIGVLCTVSCVQGYAFASPPAEEYFCAYEDGTWLPVEKFPFPDCSVIQLSNDILQPATITLSGEMSCDDSLLLHRIEKHLEGAVSEKLSRACDSELSCSLDSVTSVCEGQKDYNKVQVVLGRRSRRSATNKAQISFELMLEGIAKTSDLSSSKVSDSLHKALSVLHQEANLGHLNLLVDGQTLTFAKMTYDIGKHTFRCPEGSVLVNHTCVSCPVGTFYNVITTICEDCPKGTYQPREGHNTCLKCPDNTSTEKNHTRSLEECKELCLPGTWSSNGLSPCITCMVGEYQNRYQSTTCLKCPRGTSTARRGIRRKKECASLCPPGYSSESGLVPCMPCPKGTYQHKIGQMGCFRCPRHGITRENGATSVKKCIEEGFQADTPESSVSSSPYYSTFSDEPSSIVPFNVCFSEPCQNGGTCSVSSSGSSLYTCQCPKGFTGSNCEKVVDLCEVNPCANGGVCESLFADFICYCEQGFTGPTCEENIDDCLSSPCQNSATCVDGIDSYTCNCAPGYTGTDCETPINDCADSPCRNGGTCVNSLTGFSCICPEGFSGETCEVDKDDCMGITCENGGTCRDLIGEFVCDCVPGFTGEKCEVNIDECAAQPCQHGSTCVDDINDYTCICTQGYSGKKCEQTLNGQYQLDFVSPTIMDYAQLTIDQPLDVVTVAMWIKTTDTENQGTPLSYAVAGEPNALTITNYKNLNFMVNGETISVPKALNDGQWHHLAFIWLSNRGEWKVYVEGELIDHSVDLSTAKAIPGKGILVIGQEQDTFGGGFSPSETFVGSLSHLNIWDQELSLNQIEQLRFSCGGGENGRSDIPEKDHLVVSWPQIQEALKGNVIKTPSDFCSECPEPTSIEHGSVSYESRKPGGYALYECGLGFQMSGREELRCLVSGVWDGPPPTCIAVNCGHPGRIDNGYSQGSKYSYGSVVTFKCRRGYELKGASSLTCDEYGEWDDDKPDCVPIVCRLPLISENTIAQTDKTEFAPNEEVSFTCKPGSLMQTPHDTVRCQRDGSWDKSVPTCDAITCGEPPAIENGEPFSLNVNFNVGDSVRYQCNPGYEFNPDSRNSRGTLDCLPTGQFSDDLPVCGPIKCSEPPNIPNTVRTGDDSTYLAQVTYECAPGFVSVGQGPSQVTTECQADAKWSPFSIMCRPISCGEPPSIPNGLVTGDLFILNAEVTYSCAPGFRLQGDAVRRCETDGSWSGETPSCDPVNCPVPRGVQNGDVFYTNLTYQSTADYSCQPGFVLNGAESIVCEVTGQWTPEPPTCEPLQCPIPPEIDHGTLTSSSPGLFIYNSTVEYSCDVGYILVGESVLRCDENGQWDPELPQCQPVRCPELDPPANGEVVYKTSYSSFAVYGCPRQGFRLNGVETRLCQADGTWSEEAPVCVSTQCPEPSELINGRRDYKDLSVGSIVRYDCDRGYQLQGLSIRRCQEDLTLEGSEPTCEPVECPTLTAPDNGQLALTNKNLYQSIATVICDEGHNLIGLSVRQCQASGQWVGDSPTCEPVRCDEVSGRISNGATNSTNNVFGSVLNYVCDEGYYIVGQALRTCGADGNWDNPEPRCRIVLCEEPRIDNGIVRPFQNEFGTQIEFTCHTNFRLSGSRYRTCQANGKWSGETPSCLEVICVPPDPVPNSQTKAVNRTAIEYKCDIGYDLIGSSVQVCGSDQVWTPQPPVCQIVTCPDLTGSELENGQVLYTSNEFGSKVEYSCDEGYRLMGNSTQDCLPMGLWSGSVPTCDKVSCGIPSFRSHLSFEGDITYGGIIEFKCTRGYSLVGNSTLRCLANGSWDGTIPECSQLQCPEVDTYLEHGSVTVQGQDIDAIVSFTCDDGYRLVGYDSMTCQSNGQWSGEKPTCVPLLCDPPPPLKNAVIEGLDGDKPVPVGTEILYTCVKGFDLYGHFSRICQTDGTFSNEEPVCDPSTCPEPSFVTNGFYDGVSDKLGSVITLKCFEGYEVSGEENKTCMSDYQWSGGDQESKCVKISCGPPIPVPYTIINQDEGLEYEATVTYSCIEGYQSEVATATSQCQANRQWSSFEFVCTIISCPEITSLVNGVVEGSEFTYGSKCGFTCNEGYKLQGAEEVTCLSSGHWNFEKPVCQIVTCPNLQAPINGQVFFESTQYGSIANFQCDLGYSLEGASELTCVSTGLWSHDAPKCRLVACQTPPTLLNGQLMNAQPEYFYNDMAEYTCNFGYVLEGFSSVRCLATGYFESLTAVCVRIPCPTPASIDFGLVNATEYTATYTCNQGFDLMGSAVLNCELGGFWDSEPPKCEPVPCPDPEPIEHGSIDGDVYTFGNFLLYSCDPGYQLSGYPVRVCEANRNWSKESPTCQPVVCGPPDGELANGQIQGDDFTFSQSLSYSCNPGFRLVGDAVRTCQASSRWSGKLPVCERLSCEKPEPIDNGKISGNNYEFESIVTYSCVRGYELVGQAERQCESNLRWSGEAPTCRRVSCGYPEPLLNGSIVGNEYLFGDQVNLTCDPGYRISGKSYRRCKAEGEWSNINSVCELIYCPTPDMLLENGFLNPVAAPVPVWGSISYSCNEGYTLTSRDGESSPTGQVNCLVTGEWSAIDFTCERRSCPKISSLAYGNVEGDSFLFEDIVRFTCNSGFVLEGSDFVQCLATGEWSASLPVCNIVSCPKYNLQYGFGTLEPGNESGFSEARGDNIYIYGDTLTLSCNKGYDLIGQNLVQCLAEGQWSVSSAVCLPVICGLPIIPNAIIGSDIPLTYQDKLTVTCEEDYDLIGAEELTCGADRQWEEELPRCELLACKTPPKVENAIIVGENFNVGGTITYQCKTGYTIMGNQILTCGSDSFWLGTLPDCILIDCGTPPAQFNAELQDGGSNTYGSEVTYVCDEGYTRKGNLALRCGDDYNWQRVDPDAECVPVDCGPPPPIANGQVFADSTILDSLAFYSCNQGYYMPGSSTVFCSAAGAWAVEIPQCYPVDCGEPPNLPNGVNTYGTTTYLSKAAYTCDEGYQRDSEGTVEGGAESLVETVPGSQIVPGSVVLTCGDMGTWEGELGSCVLVSCGKPPVISNTVVSYTDTTFKSKAQYSCAPGYSQGNEDTTLTCTEFGQWQGVQLYCYPIDCGQPPLLLHGEYLIENGTLYGSTISYSCDEGYVRAGPELLSCTASGLWSSTSHSCVAVDCGDPPVVDNADVEVETTTFPSQARYSCHTGFSMKGSDLIRCTGTGQWSLPRPTCPPVNCSLPPAIPHGTVTFNATTFGNRALYVCEEGYQVNYDPTVLCMEEGEWSPQPSCELVQCGEPPQTTHSTAAYNTTHFGSRVTYTCAEGFKQRGSKTLICGGHGKWLGLTPLCTKVQCPPVPIPKNGQVTAVSLEAGSQAIFNCDRGYRLEGQSIAECTSEGTWSIVTPRCVQVECPSPPSVPNATWLLNAHPIPDTVLTYTCVKGYRLQGQTADQASVICGQNGAWLGALPVCVPVECAPLPEIENGYWFTTGNIYGSSANVRCEPGYTVSSNGQYVCQADSQWRGPTVYPECLPVDCGSPPFIEGAAVVPGSQSYLFGSQLAYSCLPGHGLTGQPTLTCTADGKWSTPAFKCTVFKCPPLSAPAGGQMSSYPIPPPVGTVVTFTCDPALTLVGRSQLTCTTSGNWDYEIPTCQKIIRASCGHPEVEDPHSVKVIGSSYNVGDRVMFMCRFGYSPVKSPPILTCLANGQWDGQAKCIANCKQECLNGGRCLGMNRCKCMPGWTGNRCEQAVCILPCLHGGRCVAPYTCSCLEGYSGSRCQRAICDQPCQNGGLCVGPNRCHCSSRFTGQYCQIMNIGQKG